MRAFLPVSFPFIAPGLIDSAFVKANSVKRPRQLTLDILVKEDCSRFVKEAEEHSNGRQHARIVVSKHVRFLSVHDLEGMEHRLGVFCETLRRSEGGVTSCSGDSSQRSR